MKVMLLLCSLLAAAAALPFQQNTIAGSAQTKNALERNQDGTSDDILTNELQPSYEGDQQQQQDFSAPFEGFASDPQEGSDDPSSGSIQSQPSFGGSPFGALLNGDGPVPSRLVVETPFQQPEVTKFDDDQFTTFGESSDKQFAGNQQQSYNNAPAQQPSFNEAPNQQPAFNAVPIQQPQFNSAPNQQPAFNAAPNQQPQFNSAPNQQPAFNTAPDQPYSGGAPVGSPLEPFNVAIVGDGDFYLRTALPNMGYQPTQYTSLDLSNIDFENFENSGHKEYITIPENDYSGENEVYRLVGVAPSTAVKGGSAITYSANIGDTVPVYSELDDIYEHQLLMQYMASRPTTYSGQGQRPWTVRAESAVTGGDFVVLLDD